MTSGDRLYNSLFGDLVQRNFQDCLALNDSEVTSYITGLLSDFADSENLYKVRDTRGRRLDEVAEMMVESNPLLDAPSFDRERAVRKHIGDFTLFLAGMFPESLKTWRMRHARLDSLIDYVKAGKESYNIVAAFNQFEYRKVAPLFRRLSDDFEMYVYGLHLVRQELDLGQPDFAATVRDIIC